MDTPRAAATTTTEQDDPTIWRVDDALWALLEPLLKSEKVRKKPGRPRRDDRTIFDGLIWLARTGAQWSQLPRAFGPKSTVHERFSGVDRDGSPGAGVGGAATRVRRGHRLGLDLASGRRMYRQGSVRYKGGAGEAQATGRNPTDRGKPGTKRHLLTEAKGLPGRAGGHGRQSPRHDPVGRPVGRDGDRADALGAAPSGAGPGLRLCRRAGTPP